MRRRVLLKPSKTRLVNGMPSKILFLDIETKPAKVYTFRMWDASINPEQVIEPGGTICVGAKWMGSKETIFFSDWDHGHEAMLREVHALITEADAIVTYNGDKFDLPKLWGEFLLNGMKPPQPPTSIDILKAVKKLGFDMNRLAYIGPLLKIGKKLKHEGFGLCATVMEGDGTAKGGVVLAIANQFKIPVKYIGVGEKMDDLIIFDKHEFVDSLFKGVTNG